MQLSEFCTNDGDVKQATKGVLNEEYRAAVPLPFGIERGSSSVHNDAAGMSMVLGALNDSHSVIAQLLALIYVGDH